MRLFKKNDLPQRFKEIGQVILENIDAKVRDHDRIQVRHMGAIVALDFAEKDAGYLAGIGEKLRTACLNNQEVLLRPLGSVLYTFPLACLTDEEAAKVGAALSEIALGVLH